jgi:hypothetical protein
MFPEEARNGMEVETIRTCKSFGIGKHRCGEKVAKLPIFFYSTREFSRVKMSLMPLGATSLRFLVKANGWMDGWMDGWMEGSQGVTIRKHSRGGDPNVTETQRLPLEKYRYATRLHLLLSWWELHNHPLLTVLEEK